VRDWQLAEVGALCAGGGSPRSCARSLRALGASGRGVCTAWRGEVRRSHNWVSLGVAARRWQRRQSRRRWTRRSTTSPRPSPNHPRRRGIAPKRYDRELHAPRRISDAGNVRLLSGAGCEGDVLGDSVDAADGVCDGEVLGEAPSVSLSRATQRNADTSVHICTHNHHDWLYAVRRPPVRCVHSQVSGPLDDECSTCEPGAEAKAKASLSEHARQMDGGERSQVKPRLAYACLRAPPHANMQDAPVWCGVEWTLPNPSLLTLAPTS